MKKMFLLSLGLILSLGIFAQNNAYEFNDFIQKASAEYDKKNFKLALEFYEKALALNQQTIAYYNAACCASLIGELSKSADYLNKSIDREYLDKEWMVNDTDFEALKKTSDWQKIIEKIDKKISTLEAEFAGVKKMPLSDLVPFYQNGKWGYLYKNDRKIAISPIFRNAKFGGDCLSVQLDRVNWIDIDGNGKFKIIRPSALDFMPPPPPDYPHRVKVDTTKGFKGFRINEYGLITHASSYYDEAILSESIEGGYGGYEEAPETSLKVHSPAKIEGVWWAIAAKNEKYGLIDEQGNIHKKIPFNYQTLSLVKGTKKGETWYFFKDMKNEHGLINPKGEVKFYKEFDLFNPYSLENTGFAEVRKGNLMGVIDLFSLGWAVKPAKLLVGAVHFSYLNGCGNSYNLLRNRDKIKDIYFLCQDSDGTTYYLGRDGIKYLPVE
jgi:tetratricopeptide (TPR) repeat protein